MTSPENAYATQYSGGLSRHGRDAVSLMGGLLLVLVGGAALLADLTDVSIQARWVVPVILLVVGVAGLLATLRPGSSTGQPGTDLG